MNNENDRVFRLVNISDKYYLMTIVLKDTEEEYTRYIDEHSDFADLNELADWFIKHNVFAGASINLRISEEDKMGAEEEIDIFNEIMQNAGLYISKIDYCDFIMQSDPEAMKRVLLF